MANVYTNERFVQRRNKIGTYAGLAGFLILMAGLYVSLNPDNHLSLPIGGESVTIYFIWLAYLALIAGVGLSVYGSRFLIYTRLEPEKKLGLALKGLDKQYRLYSFSLPVPHVLLTPSGVVILHVKPQEGEIRVRGARWSQPLTPMRALRYMTSEGIGNPPQELGRAQDKMTAWLAERLPGVTVPVSGYVIVLDPRARVSLESPTVPLVLLNQDSGALKDALRRDKKQNLNAPLYNRLVAVLGSPNAQTAVE